MSDPVVQESPGRDVAETQQFRSQVGHISRHSGVLFAGTIFTAALSYLFKIYIARTLGAEALGVYALGMTLSGFIGIFTSLGLPESAIRFGAIYRANNKPEQLRALLCWGGTIVSAASFLCAVIFFPVARVVALRFYHSPGVAHYLPWFLVLMISGAVSVFYNRILAGYKAIGQRTVINNFIGSPANMLFAVALISLGWGLTGYLLAQVLSATLVIALLLLFVWKRTPEEARFLFPAPKFMDREVWSFSAAAAGVLVLEFLMGQIDKIALGYYLDTRSVGIYSVAAAVVAYETLILSSVNQVFSPMIADLHSRGETAMLGRLYQSLTKWVFGVTFPLAITVMIYAHPILRMFGHDFEAGWPILLIGTIGQLVNCGVGSVALLLMMSGNQRRLLRVQTTMTGIMTVSNIALIPIWGIVGAAVASAITNIGLNAWNFLGVRRVLGLSPFNRSFMRLSTPALASILLALFLRREQNLFRHDWLAIGVGLLAAYGIFVAVTAALGLDADDRLIVGAVRNRVLGSPSSGMES